MQFIISCMICGYRFSSSFINLITMALTQTQEKNACFPWNQTPTFYTNLYSQYNFGTQPPLYVIEDKLRYIAVKPSASISCLRQKIWHLLDLPDYCEEVIILKSHDDYEIPLTRLKRGNDPQHPYILEVWLPGEQKTLHSNMLTLGTSDTKGLNKDNAAEDSLSEEKVKLDYAEKHFTATKPAMSNDTIGLNKLRILKNHPDNILPSDYKQSDISCKISTSSLFFKLHGKKSRDNFANILMKIQSDLNTLSNKLSNLENKIQL